MSEQNLIFVLKIFYKIWNHRTVRIVQVHTSQAILSGNTKVARETYE